MFGAKNHTTILIISTIIIYQQINHAKGRDLGYNRSQVITTNLQGDLSKHIDLIKDHRCGGQFPAFEQYSTAAK